MNTEFYAIPKKDGNPRRIGRYYIAVYQDGSELAVCRLNGRNWIESPSVLEIQGYKRFKK